MFDPKLKEALGRVQKPGRYTGGEPGSIYKEKDKVDVRFAFCFPDTYEVGMSFLGEKILYELLNSHENWWCERAFMPWLDMKAEMERLQLPLYTMESKDPLTAFDAVGFTLQYELSYTNILAMLDLAGIPFYSKDRDDRWPLIVAGGPCACNAEPIADFFDVIQLGEGENQLPAICAEIEKAKKEGISKKQLLLNIAKIPGVYIPAFYDVTYHEDGRVKAITPNEPGIPARITKAIIKDLNQFAPPTNFVVPMVGAIQDRASIEVLQYFLNWDEKKCREEWEAKDDTVFVEALEKVGVFQRLRSMTSAGLQGPQYVKLQFSRHHRQLRSRYELSLGMHLRDQIALGVTPSKVPDWTAFLSMLIGLFYNKTFRQKLEYLLEQISEVWLLPHWLDLANVEVLAADDTRVPLYMLMVAVHKELDSDDVPDGRFDILLCRDSSREVGE